MAMSFIFGKNVLYFAKCPLFQNFQIATLVYALVHPFLSSKINYIRAQATTQRKAWSLLNISVLKHFEVNNNFT
jgi:hypothetical protein